MLKIFTNFRLENDAYFDVLRKYQNKPITFFYDYVPTNIQELQLNPYNFIMVHEPNEFFGIHNWVKNNHDLFDVILTWNDDILNTCHNAYPFTCNYQQDSLEYYSSFKEKNKKFEVSFLSGIKTITQGHILRNNIYSIKDDITIPKKWFHVLDDFDTHAGVRPGYGNYTKNLSHIPDHLKLNPQVFGKRICYDESMFHVCVENVKHNNWYTEKIGEALCTKTIPIYWGCPNIGDFYDERGIITFDSIENLLEILNSLTPQNYYEMKPYVDYNYEIAMQDSFQNKLDSFLEEVTKINKL